MKLHAYQRDFMAALWHDVVVGPLAALSAQPGFAVYRNTVMKGCVDALEANYPAVTALVGRDWLRAAAAGFVSESPPTQASLLDYGAGFADFLARFPPAAELPWLASVAQLDRDWTESHLAPDASTVDPVSLVATSPATLAGLCLRPHPASRWRWSADIPAFSLWSISRGLAPQPENGFASLPWRGEGALTTRDADRVETTAIPRAACAMLDACAAGETFSAAAAAALTLDPAIDLPTLISSLLRTGALTTDDPHFTKDHTR